MSEAAYRKTYRVERTLRPVTPEEAEFIAARRHDQHSQVVVRESQPVKELRVALVVGVGAVMLGLFLRNSAFIFAGTLMTVFLVFLTILAYRKSRGRIARAKGPWDTTSASAQIEETRIFARSVVGAVSGDEDYVSWVLFEIPGDDWLFVDPVVLEDHRSPPSAEPADGAHAGEALAFAEVCLRRLAPRGPYLAVRTKGDRIPFRGASPHPDAYAPAFESGWIWRPGGLLDEHGNELPFDDADFPADGRVRASSLPAWMRELVG